MIMIDHDDDKSADGRNDKSKDPSWEVFEVFSRPLLTRVSATFVLAQHFYKQMIIGLSWSSSSALSWSQVWQSTLPKKLKPHQCVYHTNDVDGNSETEVED